MFPSPTDVSWSARPSSFPTPPRTYRRCKRGCSHNDCNSESDGLGNQGPALSSTDEGDAEFQRLRIKSLKGWWPRSILVSRTKVGDRRIWMTNIDEEGTDVADLSSAAPLLYRNLWNSHIQRLVVGCHLLRHPSASVNSGNFTCRRSWTFCDCWALHHHPRHGQKGFQFPSSPIIIDSPHNSSYMAPGSPSPHESSNVTAIMKSPLWHRFCSFSPFL